MREAMIPQLSGSRTNKHRWQLLVGMTWCQKIPGQLVLVPSTGHFHHVGTPAADLFLRQEPPAQNLSSVLARARQLGH